MPSWWKKLIEILNAINGIISGIDKGMTPGAAQNVDGSVAHTESTVIDADNAVYVRMVSENSAIRYIVGETPEATTNDTILPAGVVEKILIPVGNKISVFGGILNITKMS